MKTALLIISTLIAFPTIATGLQIDQKIEPYHAVELNEALEITDPEVAVKKELEVEVGDTGAFERIQCSISANKAAIIPKGARLHFTSSPKNGRVSFSAANLDGVNVRLACASTYIYNGKRQTLNMITGAEILAILNAKPIRIRQILVGSPYSYDSLPKKDAIGFRGAEDDGLR